jgi:hypothetical protein
VRSKVGTVALLFRFAAAATDCSATDSGWAWGFFWVGAGVDFDDRKKEWLLCGAVDCRFCVVAFDCTGFDEMTVFVETGDAGLRRGEVGVTLAVVAWAVKVWVAVT